MRLIPFPCPIMFSIGVHSSKICVFLLLQTVSIATLVKDPPCTNTMPTPPHHIVIRLRWWLPAGGKFAFGQTHEKRYDCWILESLRKRQRFRSLRGNEKFFWFLQHFEAMNGSPADDCHFQNLRHCNGRLTSAFKGKYDKLKKVRNGSRTCLQDRPTCCAYRIGIDHFSQRGPRAICSFVYIYLFNQLAPVDWRLLLEEHIVKISTLFFGMLGQFFWVLK